MHHISLFYPLALQERYGKEAGKSTAAIEGQGDQPEGHTPTILSPMPLAEVELKWEMEKEEKKLLWEQLQGLEVSLGLLGLGCQAVGRCPSSAHDLMEMVVTSQSHGRIYLGGRRAGEGTRLTYPLLMTAPSFFLPCRVQSKPKHPGYRKNLLR